MWRVDSARLDSPRLIEGNLTPQNQELGARSPPVSGGESGQRDPNGQQPQNNLD